MRTSCIYGRGLTPAFSGSVAGTPAQIEQSLKPDASRFTSLVMDGHGSSYICGFGSIYMNGRFPNPDFYVDPNYGWVGDYKRKDVNTQGCIRHLTTNLRFITRAYRSQNWLVISDSLSMTDTSSMNSWGQLVKFLDASGFNVLAHTPAEIQAGAYGYDTRPEYFLQFAGVLLLLAGKTALNNNLARALTDSITLGASVAVLQKSPTEGNIPFNQIFSPLGVETDTAGYMAAFQSSVNTSKSLYQDHVVWTKIRELHIQCTHRISATYKILATGKGKTDNVAGNKGNWTAINCLEVSDETDIRQPVFYQSGCCVKEGDRYEAEFTAPMFPYMPENFQEMFDKGYLKGTWTSDNGLPLAQRSKIWLRCAGKNGGDSHVHYGNTDVALQQGYTVFRLTDRTLVPAASRRFDTAAGGQGSAAGVAAAKAMADYIGTIPDGDYVLVVSHSNAQTNHTAGGLPAAIYSIGGSRRTFEASWFKTGSCYVLFGRKGNVEGNNTIEMYYLSQPIEGVTQPNAFTTGFNVTDEDIPYCCGTEELVRNNIEIKGLVNNGQMARLKYSKRLISVDGSKKYGIRHETYVADQRFKKLPINDRKNTVVSVENPCIPVYDYDELDWIRVWKHDTGVNSLAYVFKDQYEYMIVLRDNSGQIFTWNFTFFYDIYQRCGNILWDNNAGNSQTKITGSAGSGTVLRDDRGSMFLQVYERKITVVPAGTTPSRTKNEWELWGAYDNSRKYVNLQPGYEYIMHIEDWHGENEFAQKRMLVPFRNQEPQWSEGDWYYCGGTNSNSMAIFNRTDIEYYNGKNKNPITRILRRPIFYGNDPESKSEWTLAHINSNRAVLPQGAINFPMERDYEYSIIAVGNTRSRNYTSISVFTWNRIFDLRESGGWPAGKGIEGSDSGVCGWDYSGSRIPARIGVRADLVSMVMDSEAPYGVHLIMKRKMRAWEPEEVNPAAMRGGR